jgi:hypothetical protein
MSLFLRIVGKTSKNCTVGCRLKARLYESNGSPLLSNVYNKNAYFSGNGVKTSSVSAVRITLTTAASETVKTEGFDKVSTSPSD